MGNRAVITFHQKPTLASIGVYLHWNGGEESVLAFAEALEHFHVRDGADESYQLARFIQIIGNYFGGTLSLGVDLLANLDCDNGDNGVFSIMREKGQVTIRQNNGDLKKWTTLDNAQIKKHGYWNADPDDKDGNILDQVIAKNSMLVEK